jgi:uncharacterized protein YqfA (UPF0365 family)
MRRWCMNFEQFALVVILVVFLLFPVVLFIAMVRLGTPWLRAYMSGTPVSIFDILGMRLRRTDIDAVIKSLIAAKQGGVVLACRQVEQAYLQGVDLEKLTLAIVQARKTGIDTTWEELVNLELEHRLAEKFKPQGPSM